MSGAVGAWTSFPTRSSPHRLTPIARDSEWRGADTEWSAAAARRRPPASALSATHRSDHAVRDERQGTRRMRHLALVLHR
jgi:hypothetical protein